MIEVGAVLGARYRLQRLIGGGSMGSVFQAASDGGDVAIKVLHLPRGKKKEREADERRARFVREAAVCAAFVHPNVVPVLDHGIDAATNTPYLVMPLLRGEDLAQVITREGALEPAPCVAIFVQACRGLGAAHASGIVHRDVKPSNLFLDGDGEDSRAIVVKVADFGLAKVFDDSAQSLTASGRFMGTPQYVSPEQATNAKDVDARSDVWSLAMSLYHALAGRPAFAHVKSFMALVLELTGANGVPPLQRAAPWVAPALARVVHGALVADPDQRCPSMPELALALELAAGLDVAQARITKAQVHAASPATRASLAEIAELPASWEELIRFG